MNVECTVTNSDTPSLIADLAKIFIHDNVKDYKYDCTDFNAWHIACSESSSAQKAQQYFIIDTHFHEGFSHWFFESAIYLPTFLELKTKIPNLKLHLKSGRKYKTDICRYFNINESDITYELMMPNTCHFPAPITAFNEKVCTQEYIDLVYRLRSYFPQPPTLKSRNLLFFPRQKVDNYPYQNNERINDSSHVEEMLVQDVTYTNTFQSFADQVHAIQSTRKLLIPDGAAFLVNAFLLSNCKVIVLGNVTDYQACHFPKYGFINNMLVSSNQVHKISYEQVGGTYERAIFRFEHVEPHI